MAGEMATAAEGTHPTGMHSSLFVCLFIYLFWSVYRAEWVTDPFAPQLVINSCVSIFVLKNSLGVNTPFWCIHTA